MENFQSILSNRTKMRLTFIFLCCLLAFASARWRRGRNLNCPDTCPTGSKLKVWPSSCANVPNPLRRPTRADKPTLCSNGVTVRKNVLSNRKPEVISKWFRFRHFRRVPSVWVDQDSTRQSIRKPIEQWLLFVTRLEPDPSEDRPPVLNFFQEIFQFPRNSILTHAPTHLGYNELL